MKKKIRFYNRLFYQVYFYFSLLLTIFTILLGIIFIQLYQENSMDIYVSQLKKKAIAIANQISDYAIEKRYSQYLNYMEAVESMEDSDTTDVWILSNADAEKPLKRRYQNVRVLKKNMPKDMRKVLNKAFKDKTTHSSSYDEIYGTVTLRLATPIYDGGGNVMGAVLLNSIVESQQEIVSQGKYLILISTLAAWLVSALLTAIFAGQLSGPISRMRKTALKLADGDYSKKTGIRRKDEIGDLASSIDILSEKLQDNEIERNNMEQMRQDFFANVSHELRTPITVLRGYTETLSDGYVSDEDQQKKYYDRMLAECKGMERLVGDLLTLSVMQNTEFQIKTEPILISQVFDDIKKSVKVLSEKKNIKLQMKETEPCFILGDYDRFRQMLLVILDNAIKFSSENSNIDVYISCEEKVKIEIRDYGVGISEEDLPNIFDKFYKSNLQMNEKGSGLGLVIAKNIALKHGGDIQVKSEIGHGTTFTFTFDKLEISEDLDFD